jgi:hypothetical protein
MVCCPPLPRGVLLHLLGAFPPYDDLRPSVGREIVEALSRRQVAEDRDLVWPVADPAEFVETAQHAVRSLAAVPACSHLLDPVAVVGVFNNGSGAGESDRNQFASQELVVATEDNLD